MLLLSFMVAVVVPYFSDLMDIYSAVSIFALSIWIPALLLILSQQGQLSLPLLVFSTLLMVLGIVGTCLGTWAALDDLVDKLRYCSVRFGY